MDGGLDAWRASGRAVVTDDGESDVPGLDEARARTRSVSPGDLNEMLSGGDLLVIDVKGSGDYALDHITGSRWVPRGDLERRIGSYADSTDTRIVVTDNDGVRAALASATLNDLGYVNVSWLAGGLDAWRAAGFETVQGLDGADVSLKEAKEDVEMIGRVGPLARDRQDMLDYLEWEIELGHKYETEAE
jgi:rhodanese-related sulfurtransferase